MISSIWNTFFYIPIYNILILLVQYIPNHSMFFSVVILTIFVRIILYPLSYKAIQSQIEMNSIQEEIEKIKREISDPKEQAQETMKIYKKHGINPFSSFFTVFLQFPIIIALYKVFQDFLKSGINEKLLYSFVSYSGNVNFETFGIHLSEKSVILALFVGITQYIYLRNSEKFRKSFSSKRKKKSDTEIKMELVTKSMKYTMPVFIFFLSYVIGAALSLYFLVSNIFLILQEIYIYKKIREKLF